MNRNARKNRMMFLGGTIVATSTIGIFISMSIFFAVPQTARAYAVGPLPTSTQSASGSYDFGSSLQNLVSPFTNFFSSLKFNNNTTIKTSGPTSGFPTINLAPGISNGAQNILSQWLIEFDNWFYGVSGVQLSGIFQVLLNAIAWTLGLAQQAVNWLLGLFH
ncbi:MAG TPA: hypothetical protein VIJ29_00365 [Candidatus Paceibacterota bacterium]